MILSSAEIEALTAKLKPSAQARVLEHMGIPYRRRPDGTLAVLRVHVETVVTRPREPKLRLA